MFCYISVFRLPFCVSFWINLSDMKLLLRFSRVNVFFIVSEVGSKRVVFIVGFYFEYSIVFIASNSICFLVIMFYFVRGNVQIKEKLRDRKSF